MRRSHGAAPKRCVKMLVSGTEAPPKGIDAAICKAVPAGYAANGAAIRDTVACFELLFG